MKHHEFCDKFKPKYNHEEEQDNHFEPYVPRTFRLSSTDKTFHLSNPLPAVMTMVCRVGSAVFESEMIYILPLNIYTLSMMLYPVDRNRMNANSRTRKKALHQEHA